MSSLAQLNGEALAVSGLRFWGTRSDNGLFRLIAQSDAGAIELWQQEQVGGREPLSPIGGIEIHSPTQPFDFDPEPAEENCEILGGRCWVDGSSLKFSERFYPLIRAGDSQAVLAALAEWHDGQFGAGVRT